MTTPRVTVPVDEQVIKRLQEEADHPGIADSVMVFGPDLRALLRAYQSLSAAPAPEGGAVLADACRTAARSYAETNDDYMVDLLLKAATALATREETPAEVGAEP